MLFKSKKKKEPAAWPPQGWPAPDPPPIGYGLSSTPAGLLAAKDLDPAKGLEAAAMRAISRLALERHTADFPTVGAMNEAYESVGEDVYDPSLAGCRRAALDDSARILYARCHHGAAEPSDRIERIALAIQQATGEVVAAYTEEAALACLKIAGNSGANLRANAMREGIAAAMKRAKDEGDKDAALAAVMDGYAAAADLAILMPHYSKGGRKGDPSDDDCRQIHGFPPETRTYAKAERLSALMADAIREIAAALTTQDGRAALRDALEHLDDDHLPAELPPQIRELIGKAGHHHAATAIVHRGADRIAAAFADALTQSLATAGALAYARLTASGAVNGTAGVFGQALTRAAVQIGACVVGAATRASNFGLAKGAGGKIPANTPPELVAASFMLLAAHHRHYATFLEQTVPRAIHALNGMLAPAWNAAHAGRTYDAATAALDALDIQGEKDRRAWTPFALRLAECPTAPLILRRVPLATFKIGDKSCAEFVRGVGAGHPPTPWNVLRRVAGLPPKDDDEDDDEDED